MLVGETSLLLRSILTLVEDNLEHTKRARFGAQGADGRTTPSVLSSDRQAVP